ncbi:glycosyltransferase [Arachidicoccus ginsenosidivorans]|uniref:Glycosyltransferase n=1 Tax=Arachidicoccus ginsenosidivorans TaxID=496057 RepID=A0A5B8VNT5_9BACT|nr:glycosyltransferase [Arachidicoccus ginsenosidivorans]QEC72883.1 glycosyltransferase [Arachidicoccus ginsenosidivorans]
MTISSILIDFTLLLLILYGILLLIYRLLWQKLRPLDIRKAATVTSRTQQIRFSVIIPARNEQDNIGNCLLSILKGNYPNELYEIIVVDDFSEDNTLSVLQTLQLQYPGQIKVIELATLMDKRPINSYKKKALELAIGQSSGDWIVTTDADCMAPVDWLSCYDLYIAQTGKRFVAAPVRFKDTGSFVSKFQCLDFLSLQGVTGAAVGGGVMSMCNGANLGYEKAFFYEVGGFSGIDKLASGDDMLLMAKMQARLPGSIGYLFAQEAIVITLPMADWGLLLTSAFVGPARPALTRTGR